ncbi:MAG: HEAT repeat domain-containing protein [Vicinamibacterales bacterium]
MIWFDSTLFIAAALAILAWAALSGYIVLVQRRRDVTRDTLESARLALDRLRSATPEARRSALDLLFRHSSRELLMRCAAERDLSADAFLTLVSLLEERWTLDSLIDDATFHETVREKWRRLTALRILARLEHPRVVELLGRAVEDADREVVECALALLGRSQDPGAVDRLLEAFTAAPAYTSRIAVYLDQSPHPIGHQLAELLNDKRPVVRQWAATLLSRYPDDVDESRLAWLTNDVDANVRKAAIQTLGQVGTGQAAACAVHLLADAVPFVRAHAARALAELGRADYAKRLADLLGDKDWWVRLAARESLELMGTEVWPVLVRCLDHPDKFVRNGAAEIVQNLGVLDNLILLEAASDYPTRSKLDMLKRITDAGGIRLTESLVERAGPVVGPRVRRLLDSIGLERVGAA